MAFNRAEYIKRKVKTYDDLVNKMGEVVTKFTNSNEYRVLERQVTTGGIRKNTCDRCLSKAERIYPLHLEHLLTGSTFPFHYVVLCDKCASIYLDKILLNQVK